MTQVIAKPIESRIHLGKEKEAPPVVHGAKPAQGSEAEAETAAAP